MTTATADSTRKRILVAATRLLSDGGAEAASTRAISAAAGVQAPAIYRLFGDKQGLLDAVAVHALETYLEEKSTRAQSDDPVEDLREGWDDHIAFGLSNPTIYPLIYSQVSRGTIATSTHAGGTVVEGHMRRIAEAGRLRVPEPRAAQLVYAAGRGTVLTLIATPESERDPALSSLAREAVISAITAEQPGNEETPGLAAAAITLRAGIDGIGEFSRGEQALLAELLDRIPRE